jgi:hypothetical protein
MQTSTVVNVSKILQADSIEYLSECVGTYTASGKYDVALKIATLSKLPVNDILKAEWTHKYEVLVTKEDVVLEEKDLTLFIAQCSEAFKKASVSLKEATEFLMKYVERITDALQQYYSYRIILSWFMDKQEYGPQREWLEHRMWNAYFLSDHTDEVFLNSFHSTLHFILNGQKDPTTSRKIGLVNAERPFSMTCGEIEIESDVGNIEDVVTLEEPEAIDNWRRVISQLIELRLLVEAFRLSALFKTPPEYRYRYPACPVQIVRTCLKLAEGTCSPYELPQELRLVISLPVIPSKLSGKYILL